MGDAVDIEVQLPAYHFRLAQAAFNELLRASGDYERFMDLDAAMIVLIAKWQAYAFARRVAASRRDNGTKPEGEIMVLEG